MGGSRSSAGYAGRVGVLTVDLTAYGVVMSADSQPIEAMDGVTRVLGQPGRRHTRNPILTRNAGGFAGFTGYVGTETIGGKATRDWLDAFGAGHSSETSLTTRVRSARN
jgi:hypothetical protein